jgi:uncharacterized membrane-anchored protein YjiN (DUF445 family)
MEKKTKHIASVSLGVMAAGFAATFALPGSAAGVQLLQSGFEAGLVGGLADWFAVTALFRHPLGIPIPHTALLPRNREKVTNALVSAIENELLSKASITAKLGSVRLTAALLELLAREDARGPLAAGAAAALQGLVRHTPHELLVPFAAEQAKEALRGAAVAPLLRRLGELIAERGLDERAFDALLGKAELWIERPDTRDTLGRLALGAFEKLEVGGFMGFAVNAFMGYLNEDKLGGIIQNFVRSYLLELQLPHHPRREEALVFVRSQLLELSRSEQLAEQLEQWKTEQLEKLDLTEPIGRMLASLQERLAAALGEPGFAERTMRPMLDRALDGLQGNGQLQERLDAWLREQLIRLVEANHAKIGQLVRDNVNKLDNETLIAMMEDKVGKDLQWIRVNGAVCGFLIGIVLGAVKIWAQ